MKRIITFFALFQLFTFVASAQTESREVLAEQVNAYRSEVFKAAVVFLDARNPLKTRLNAVATYPFLYDEGQIAEARKIAVDEKQDPTLRAVALSKLVNVVPDDDELGNKVIDWMKTPNSPKPLRDESLKMMQALSFSGFSMYTKWQQLVAALRTMTKDSQLEYRQFAFNYLLAHGDSYAQGLLTNQLDNNKEDLLPTSEAVAVLTLNPHGDYLPSIFKLFQRTKDPEVKAQCVSALGSYIPAKNSIVAILKDKKQPPFLRNTALGVINANYPGEFAAHALVLLSDQKESESLKAAAISMEMFRRQSNQERARRRTADVFDKSISRMKGSSSPLLRKICGEYLENVRPNL